MSRRFIKPRTDRLFRDAVEGLVDDLSKKSTFYVVNTEDGGACGNCIYDPVHHCSSGVYNQTGPKPFTGKVCPACKGKGAITTTRQTKIPAIIQWGKAEKSAVDKVTPQGSLPQGYARIKAKVRYFAQLSTAQAYIVDGLRCSRVTLPIKRGLQSHVICEMVVAIDE